MFPFLYNAKAIVLGGTKFPNIYGTFWFRETKEGVIVTAKVFNLPTSTGICKNRIFGVHIHENGNCINTSSEAFPNAGSHYSPNNCNHPEHAGDLSPLFENNGYAYYSFLTNRFSIKDILNKSIIIHENADDFTSQPSGNSGTKIACGIIKKINI